MYKEYASRWIVVIAFSLCCAFCAAVWVTLGPLAAVVENTYDVSTTVFVITTYTFHMVYIPSSLVSNYVASKYGIRVAIICGITLTATGAWLKVLVSHSFMFVVLGMVVAGIGQPFCLNLSSTIS